MLRKTDGTEYRAEILTDYDYEFIYNDFDGIFKKLLSKCSKEEQHRIKESLNSYSELYGNFNYAKNADVLIQANGKLYWEYSYGQGSTEQGRVLHKFDPCASSIIDNNPRVYLAFYSNPSRIESIGDNFGCALTWERSQKVREHMAGHFAMTKIAVAKELGFEVSPFTYSIKK